ncbi:MFS transporter [Streptomyces rubiginosohelvolus]|uniref:MFS transporter n=1 Tax=Streptomyces rubiginosohelvolus TaxID=67362 RepID=UPI00371BD332
MPSNTATSVLESDQLQLPTAQRASRRWGFWAVAGVVFVVMAASSAPSALYGLYQQHWHMGTTASTLIYSSYAAGAILTLLLAGSVAGHIGSKRTIVLALSVISFSFIVFMVASGPWLLGLARLLQGIGVGLLTSSAGTALARLHRDKSRKGAAAVNSAATSMGIALGAVSSGLLVEHAPAPLLVPFIILAVLSMGGLLAISAIPDWEKGTTRPARPWRPRLLRLQTGSGRVLLRVAPIVTAGWAVVGLYLALGVEMTSTLLHTQDRALSALVILVVQGAGGITPMLFQRLSDRVSSVIGCALLIAGLALSVWGYSSTLAGAFFAGAAVTGAGFGLSFVGSMSTVTAAGRTGGDPALLPGFFALAYLAVSLPVVALGIASSWLGVQQAFSYFGFVVGLLALAAGILALLPTRAHMPARKVRGASSRRRDAEPV